MSITRRQVLIGSASILGYEAINRRSIAQSVAAAVAPPDFGPVPSATTSAAKALFEEIGAGSWTELNHRLHTVNADIQAHGLRHIPGVEGTFLTGYPYNEFYDWDLYFENLYLSYFGIGTYCFTNLKEFLNREQPDGYVNRSLIKQRDRQQFKPFLAQLAVLGTTMTTSGCGATTTAAWSNTSTNGFPMIQTTTACLSGTQRMPQAQTTSGLVAALSVPLTSKVSIWPRILSANCAPCQSSPRT